MKRGKKWIVTLLASSLVLGLNVTAASAKEEYSYTITLHAGEKGAINGTDGGVEVLKGCHAGDRISFDLSHVTVNDEKYYVKGVRLSGRDNEEVSPAFYVDGDADYVVAYGIKGDQVAYTVQYQDENGKTLAESETFYGNLGDKPVVAYRYIEGYIPQALAMTKTLSDNEAENVFTFVYHAEEGETAAPATPGNTTIVNVPGAAGTQAGASGTAGTTAGGGAGSAANAGTGTEGAERETDTEVEVTEPEELVDLDEIETPAGNVQLEEKAPEETSAFPMAAAGAIGAGSLAALVGLAVVVRRRIRSK